MPPPPTGLAVGWGLPSPSADLAAELPLPNLGGGSASPGGLDRKVRREACVYIPPNLEKEQE